jgi:hypothetical protein
MAASDTIRPSQLHRYGFGIVSVDKALSTNVIEVTIVEDNPMADGLLTDNATQYTASGTNAAGQSYQESLTQTNTVSATWMPMGSNRMTSPDVRYGERVAIYRMGDSDAYYWTDIGVDSNLRKLETVVYAWSGTQDESSPTDASSSYFLEVSTHTKMMHLHTSQANGELCGYDVQINPGTGKIQIQDTIGQVFLFDSINHIVQMQNVDGTVFQINKQNLTVVVPDTFNIKAKNLNLLIGQQTNIQSPTTNHNGNFNELGAFGLQGDMVTTPSGAGGVGTAGTGQINIAGDATLKGTLDVTQTLTATTIEATTSITAPNLQYN